MCVGAAFRPTASCGMRRTAEEVRERARVNAALYRQKNLELVRAKDRARQLLRRLPAQIQRAEDREAKRLAKETARAAKRVDAEARKVASRARSQEKSRLWRLKNPQRQRELVRAWKLANPEKVRAEKRRRAAHKKKSLRSALHGLQRGRCGYCRKPLPGDFHVDHIEPLARGGADIRQNLQALCPACNMSKSAKDPIDFARETGRLI